MTTFGKKSRKVRAERDRLADERERYRRLYVEMLEESPCWPQIDATSRCSTTQKST